MTTIAEFLLARIAEDEEAARGLYYPSVAIRLDEEEMLTAAMLGFACPTCQSSVGETCVAMTPPTQAPKPAAAMHATRRDLGRAEVRRLRVISWPVARVLAECEAKRRIVELHQPHVLLQGGAYCDCQGIELEGSWGGREDIYPCDTLLALASIYADHPDFREEWRA